MIVRRKSIAEKVTYINAFVTFYLLQIAYLLRTFELLNLLASKYECNNETEYMIEIINKYRIKHVEILSHSTKLVIARNVYLINILLIR